MMEFLSNVYQIDYTNQKGCGCDEIDHTDDGGCGCDD